MFDTGAKEWKTYDAWPPKILKTRFYLQGNKLSRQGQRNLHLKSLLVILKSQFRLQKISTSVELRLENT
jgi:predicted acyl esterase